MTKACRNSAWRQYLATVLVCLLPFAATQAEDMRNEAVYFIIHSEVVIDAPPERVWPFVLLPETWKELPQATLIAGERGEIGEKYRITAGEPERPFTYFIETLELTPLERKVMLIYMDEDAQSDIGYAIWSAHDLGGRTKVAYDVYALNRTTALNREEARAASVAQTRDNQPRMDADFANLKRLVESGVTLETAALETLLEDVWQLQLQRSTGLRIRNGLPVTRFEDFSLAGHRSHEEQRAQLRDRLRLIGRDGFSAEEQLNYDILAWHLQDFGVDDSDYWLTLDLTAYQAPFTLNAAERVLATSPLTTQAEADAYVDLLEAYAVSLDQIGDKLEEQTRRGILLPQQALATTRGAWEGKLRIAGARGAGLPDRAGALSATQRDSLLAAANDKETQRVAPALQRLLDHIGESYEANAPTAVGLGSLPGGDAVYARLVRRYTSMDLSAEEIHALGLRRVNELVAGMEAIQEGLGFSGTVAEFQAALREDPRFVPQSPEDIEERFMASVRKVEPALTDLFRTMPKAPYGVRKLPDTAAGGMTFGYYSPPSPLEETGIYYYNGSNLAQRNMINSASLILHELLPGHHFHLALQSENEALPTFRQNYQLNAYTEGWAEYAAHLGHELGVYEDPFDLYGRYIAEMFLSMRLVLDTGMNAKGWTLERAREFMSANVFASPVEIETETLRYATSIPGQALGYRLGMEKILELRLSAEERLGDQFDVRDFHDVVLGDGAIPLQVLEGKVDRYVEQALN